MAVLTVRNLPDEVRDRLRQRAARAGHSMEAEVRDILVRASVEPERRRSAEALRDWVKEHYGPNPPKNVVDDFIAERRREAERE
ncbi:MAG: FitA-like ribbon-helix-helix domain-containing protein [Gammaproteobacteria bacterium]